MITKKKLFISFFSLLLCSGFLSELTLDEAIGQAAAGLSDRLKSGSTVAVLIFESDSTRLSNYVIDDLNGEIVRLGRLRAVERRRLEAVRGELHFNISGEVSDESAQSIGRMVGAQSIVMGSVLRIGALYRLRFQAISTENAIIQYVFSENINNDATLASLLGLAPPPIAAAPVLAPPPVVAPSALNAEDFGENAAIHAEYTVANAAEWDATVNAIRSAGGVNRNYIINIR